MMATAEGVGGIVPVPRPSSESPWEDLPAPTPPTSPVQERAERDAVISTISLDLDGYYDVMVVGMSGMGKSTTSDKMVIAKRVGQPDPQLEERSDEIVRPEPGAQQDPQLEGSSDEIVRPKPGERQDPQLEGRSDEIVRPKPTEQRDLAELDGNDAELTIKGKKLMMHNLTFWTACSLPEGLWDRVGLFLKNLHFARVLEDSTKEINDARKEQEINPITSACQLVSNEATKMRVLDVPGFFGVQSAAPRTRQSASSLLQDDIHETAHNHLIIMRDVLRIQSAMKMVFRRILYFLPGRGPLDKQTKVLRQDLLLLAKYFGPLIFKSMILIATVQPRWSIKKGLQNELFSEEECEDTRFVFKQTLEDILLPYPHKAPLEPPVVYVSLLDTGESIVEKIKKAAVQEEFLELVFDRGMCVKCSSTIQWLEDQMVECIPVGGDENDVIPYDDSLCHPIFLPRNRRPHKIEVENGVTYIVLSEPNGRRRGEAPSEEVCHNCKQPPGSRGCWKVGTPYPIDMEEGESRKIDVDHTNHVEEHRGLVQSTEVVPEDENEGAGRGGERGGAQGGERGGEKRRPGREKRDGRERGGKGGRPSREGRLGRGGHGRKGTVRLEEEEEEPQPVLRAQDRVNSPEVSMAEDEGGHTSEMVVPTDRRRKKHNNSNSHRPCDQSDLAEAGLADVKGT